MVYLRLVLAVSGTIEITAWVAVDDQGEWGVSGSSAWHDAADQWEARKQAAEGLPTTDTGWVSYHRVTVKVPDPRKVRLNELLAVLHAARDALGQIQGRGRPCPACDEPEVCKEWCDLGALRMHIEDYDAETAP